MTEGDLQPSVSGQVEIPSTDMEGSIVQTTPMQLTGEQTRYLEKYFTIWVNFNGKYIDLLVSLFFYEKGGGFDNLWYFVYNERNSLEGSIDRLIDWLFERSIDWLMNWLIDCSIEWMMDWLIVRLIDWLVDWLIDLLYVRSRFPQLLYYKVYRMSYLALEF